MRISDWSSDVCSSDLFNAPGANANAVKELVLASLLLAARNIPAALEFVRKLDGDDKAMHEAVEAGKKKFVGFELPGRTLGVIGLGAIGVKVAYAAREIGMNVWGYDPAMTVHNAWQLNSGVRQELSRSEEHTAEIQSIMRISYAVFSLK